MSRLALRQIAADRAGSLLLALIILLGSLIGSAAPRWTTRAMDTALRATVAKHPDVSRITARHGIFLNQDTDATNFSIEMIAGSTALRGLFDDEWWAASTGDNKITNGGDGAPANLQRVINFKMLDDLTSRIRLVSGHLPEQMTLSGSEGIPSTGPGIPSFFPGADTSIMAVADAVIHEDVARALYVQVGDVIELDWRPSYFDASTLPPLVGKLGLKITGTFEPVDPSDQLWRITPTALRPVLPSPGDDSPLSRGTVLAGPEVAQELTQQAYLTLPVEWHINPRTDLIRARDVPEVLAGLTALESNPADVRSGTAQNHTTFQARFTTAFDDLLGEFQRQAHIAQSLAALGVATVALLLLAVLTLVVRLCVDRRSRALQLISARGAPGPRIGRLLAIQAGLLAMPAAVAGTAGADLLLGNSQPAAYAVPALLTLTALVGIPVAGGWSATHRDRSRPEQTGLRPSPRHLIAEAGVVLLAIIGVWLLGTGQPDAGTDVFLAIAPGLIAAAAGLLTFRLVPYVMLGLSRVLATGRGTVAYLSTVQTARRSAGALLPLVAVLIAVSVGVFAGAVQTTVERDQETASWHRVGGDILVREDALPLDAAAQIERLDGVEAVAPGHYVTGVRVSTGTKQLAGREVGINLLAVDPIAWQRVVGDGGDLGVLDSLTDTPIDRPAGGQLPPGTWPAVFAGTSADLGTGKDITVPFGDRSVALRVVDDAATVPGFAGSVLLVPAEAVAGMPGVGRENVLYIAGTPDLDDLMGITGQERWQLVQRSDVLRELRGEPVLAAAVDQFRVLLIVATALAALAVSLGLLATERVRSTAMAILRTLGLTTRQAASMMTWEVIPITLAAAAVGVGAGVAVSHLAERRIALSSFSSGATPSGIHLDPLTSLLIAAAVGISVIIGVAVAVLLNRRARLGAVLRVGDQT